MPLSWNLGSLTSWNPLGHSRPVTGLLYLYLYPVHLTVSQIVWQSHIVQWILPTGSQQHICQNFSLQFNHFNILLTSRNKRHYGQTVLNLLTHPRNFHTQTEYDWQCYVSSFPPCGFATRTEPLWSPDLKHTSTKCGLCTSSVSRTSHNINCSIYRKSYSSLLSHPICLEEVTFVMTVFQLSCALQICIA